MIALSFWDLLFQFPGRTQTSQGLFSVPVPTICISSSLEVSYRDKKGDEEASDLV